MNNLLPQAYLDKVAPAGSSIYYSLLYTLTPKREILLTLRALIAELQSIEREMQHPEPALAKLQWWQQDIARFQQGVAQHPLLQRLHVLHPTLEVPSMQNMVNAIQRHLPIAVDDNALTLETYYRDTAGTAECLMGNIYAENITASQKEWLTTVGIFMQRVKNLRDIRHCIQHQHTYLTAEDLIQHQVTLAQLTQWQTTSSIHALWQNQTAQIKKYSQQAHQLWQSSWKKNLAPTWILFNLYNTLLQELENAGFPMLQQQLHLTPLRKWWISWRQRP